MELSEGHGHAASHAACTHTCNKLDNFLRQHSSSCYFLVFFLFSPLRFAAPAHHRPLLLAAGNLKVVAVATGKHRDQSFFPFSPFLLINLKTLKINWFSYFVSSHTDPNEHRNGERQLTFS